MASIAVIELEDIARICGKFIYILQLPDKNHIITLLSREYYKSGARIIGKNEFTKDSLIVDLWQGYLTGIIRLGLFLRQRLTFTLEALQGLIYSAILFNIDMKWEQNNK